MPVIVQKYGGSSVADVAKIGLVADKVARAKKAGSDVVVVVSAMGKTTDSLLALAQSVSEAVPGATSPPRRELDMLLSTGERVTMALLSIALHARGIEAISFTGSQSGIITNDRHFDARIIEVRPHRIEDELSRGKVVIVAGYQGMSYKREITTLGRGGSDTTAVALAAALSASQCEIYSDVDGVYSADPRVVPSAAHLPEIGYDSLSEMAEAGAKVLNAQAVEWARKHRVTLFARRTQDEGGRETVTRPTERKVSAVVGLANVVLLSGARLSELAAQLNLPLLDYVGTAAPQMEAQTEAVLPMLNVPDFAAQVPALEAGGIRVSEGWTLVGLVGDGLLGPAHVLPSAMAALTKAGVAVARTFASPLRLSFLVRTEQSEVTQRALHATFCEATPLQ
jgi:aspartate kinase